MFISWVKKENKYPKLKINSNHETCHSSPIFQVIWICSTKLSKKMISIQTWWAQSSHFKQNCACQPWKLCAWSLHCKALSKHGGLVDHALKLALLIGSTYASKQTFPLMTPQKEHLWSSMIDTTLTLWDALTKAMSAISGLEAMIPGDDTRCGLHS